MIPKLWDHFLSCSSDENIFWRTMHRNYMNCPHKVFTHCVTKLSHRCFRKWLVAKWVPRYCPNQGWLIVNWTHLNRWENVIKNNNFDSRKWILNDFRKMAAIAPRPQCVKIRLANVIVPKRECECKTIIQGILSMVKQLTWTTSILA